ncbi:unnamed protein product [Brassica rapa subsp. narinosa]
MCISATAARAFKYVLQGILLSSEGEKLNSMSLMLYMFPIAVIALLPVTIVMEPNVMSVILSLARQHQYMCILLLVTKHTSRLILQDDEKLARQKEIEDWLPITSSRNAKWWYSAFHNVTAMVGAGVLGLPYAMSQLGCYSTIAWAASMSKGVREDVEYGYKAKSTAGMVFNFFSGLGDKPSKGPMWKGVIVAYIIVALSWLIATANIFVVIHVIGSYQIYAMPVFEMMETLLVKKLNFRPTTILRFCVRSFYVAATMFLGMTFPIFGGLLAFFGGFAFAPTTYFKYGLSWWANWVCIAIGIFLMVLSPIGELRTIVIQAKEYQFYS